LLLAAWALALVVTSACGPAIPAKPTWNDVEPVFEAHCNRCHGEGRPFANSTFVITSDQGQAEAKASDINKSVHQTYSYPKPMPPLPAQMLADWQIELIENWTKAVLASQ
jgi:hypothetical protein